MNTLRDSKAYPSLDKVFEHMQYELSTSIGSVEKTDILVVVGAHAQLKINANGVKQPHQLPLFEYDRLTFKIAMQIFRYFG